SGCLPHCRIDETLNTRWAGLIERNGRDERHRSAGDLHEWVVRHAHVAAKDGADSGGQSLTWRTGILAHPGQSQVFPPSCRRVRSLARIGVRVPDVSEKG
ncbi:MAG: hypothetical protein ACK5PT_18180, partial [Cereibacter sp.]